MTYLVVFFTSLLLTIFLTPYLINFFTRVKIVDLPGEERRINENVVPRMGGLIIYFMAIISIISFYGDLNSIRFFVIASLIIVSVGIVDDIVGVSWEKKFLFQFIVGIFLIYYLTPFFKSVSLFGFSIPYPADYIVLVLLIVGGINSINLLDGLDGLVSGFSLLVVGVTFFIGFYFADKFLMILSISLLGALLGFLKFNAYPARIFLGDTGSQSLGFFLMAASLIASLNIHYQVLDLTFPIILLGVPIVDTLKVMIVRLLNRKNLFLPDRSHAHHILFGMNIRHKITVFILQGFSFLYAAASLIYIKSSDFWGILMFVVVTIPFLFVDRILDLFQQNGNPVFFRDLYNKVPEIIITVFLKFLLPVLSVALLTVFVGLIPIKSTISTYLILLSIVFIIMLLIYSIIHYHKSHYLNDILVFINLIMFLIYSNYSETVSNAFSLFNFISIRQLLILIILPIVVFFLFFRERILQKKVTFLTGIDLIILVFIVLLSVSSSLLPNSHIVNINLIVFHSFLIYIFYKVIITIKVKFQVTLYYLSFILPIIIFTALLLTN